LLAEVVRVGKIDIKAWVNDGELYAIFVYGGNWLRGFETSAGHNDVFIEKYPI